MNWFDALILGIVQGLTEFLPVSSSGHLAIGQQLLLDQDATKTAMEIAREQMSFDIIVHAATVFATMVIFWYEIVRLFRGTFFSRHWNDEKSYVLKILISMIPVFVVGMFFKDQVESFFGSGLLLVGVCLLITALLLVLSEWLQKRRQSNGHDVRYVDALAIGLAQACAVLPGLSRSGTTIATGLLCGVRKEVVAQFSFLMVLIPIMGAAAKEAWDIYKGPETFDIGIFPALIGFVAAFVVGCFACRFMIEIVRRQRLSWFALYCAIIGSVAIISEFC